MANQLLPYGVRDPAVSSKVGTPSKDKSPKSLAGRMPSAEIAAKVGIDPGFEIRAVRVVRRMAKD